MSVYQVEEYYILMNNLSLNEDQKAKIEKFLADESYSNYEFQDDDTVLVIDDIDSESTGDNIEAEILELINS